MNRWLLLSVVLAGCGEKVQNASSTATSPLEARRVIGPQLPVGADVPIVDRSPLAARDHAAARSPDVSDQGLFAGIWPHSRPEHLLNQPQRWTDPVVVAREFARQYLGIPDPRASRYMAGEPGAGEVAVRRGERGPTTVIVVRQLGPQGAAGPWTVTAAHSRQIQVKSPGPLDVIGDRVTLEGESTAFEAAVDVEVRDDRYPATAPLARGFVMGGGNGDFAPFRDTLLISPPHAAAGAVVFFTQSAEDGKPMEASVVKVRFAPPTGPRQTTIRLRDPGSRVPLPLSSARRGL